jgi:CRP-like cAMP-binding protein
MPLPLGTVIGYRSLLSHDPATHTIVTLTESVVLRMPAKRFGSFAVQFPPALAALANQGGEPDEEHR